MLRIRLRRPGKSIKGRRHQKIVVTEKSRGRESRFVAEIGYYDPAKELLKIDVEKYSNWVKKGAEPSETVASLFKNYGKEKKPKKQKLKAAESNAAAGKKEEPVSSEGEPAAEKENENKNKEE